MRPLRTISGFILSSILLAASLASCGPKSTGLKDGRTGGIGKAGDDQRLIDPIRNPVGSSVSAWVQAGIAPLGSVPYDNMTLPLVSPDGQYVATQTGIPPKWSTLLAEPGAELPMLTSISIFALDRREGIGLNEIQPPRLIAEVNDMVLLGRSCDAQGFLVESPQEDGSRWIGKVSWGDGSLTWLVDGPDVNAFASLGPQGQLAWSRRAIDAQHFDLMVRNASGEWKLPSTGDDWLMPTWSGRDQGLFVFNLLGRRLQLRFAPAPSAAAFASMLQSFSIVNDAEIYHAFQSVNGQGGAIAPSAHDQLAYYHPGIKRMAVWRPMAPSGQRTIALEAESNAALLSGDLVLVSLERHLVQQNIRNGRSSVELVTGLFVPRATPAATSPFLLLAPGQDRVGLTAMRTLAPGELTSASSAR